VSTQAALMQPARVASAANWMTDGLATELWLKRRTRLRLLVR
jgi:hypothetical protein